MKTELQIAKDNFRTKYRFGINTAGTDKCMEHKQSCERSLEFLKLIIGYDTCDLCKTTTKLINNRGKDLNDAIKFYTGKGI